MVEKCDSGPRVMGLSLDWSIATDCKIKRNSRDDRKVRGSGTGIFIVHPPDYDHWPTRGTADSSPETLWKGSQ